MIMKLNISTKIIFVLTIAIVTILLIAFYLITLNESKYLRDEMKRDSLVISRVVQESLNGIVLNFQRDISCMQAIVESLGGIEGVVWVEVFDKEAEIIAHTNKERVGGKPLEEHRLYIKKIFEDSNPIGKLDRDGRYSSFVPVFSSNNEKEAVIGVVELVMESKPDTEQMKNNAIAVSKAVQVSVGKTMSDIQADREAIQTLVEHFGEIEDVMWVEIFDKESRIIAHTQKDRVGGFPLEMHKIYVQKVFGNGESIEEEDEQGGRYNVFIPAYTIDREGRMNVMGVVELVMDTKRMVEKVATIRFRMILTVVILIVVLVIIITLSMRRLVVLPITRLLDMTYSVSKSNIVEHSEVMPPDEFARLDNSVTPPESRTKLAAKGDLTSNVDIKTGDEIMQLNRSFRTMIESLRISRENLLKRTEELALSNRELEDFTSVVSHDLKAPLRAIHNYTDFLKSDLSGNIGEEQEMYLNGLGEAANQGESFIDDVLESSRIGKCQLVIERVDVGIFLRELINSLSLSSQVEIVISEDFPFIETDQTLLRQIFQNMIINGIKYNNSAKKRIEIGWELTDKAILVFFVRDNGIGIEQRFFDKIFRPFQRLHTNHEYTGSGIGLFITLKSVNRLGWSVRVESVYGHGSTFYVTVTEYKRCMENEKDVVLKGT